MLEQAYAMYNYSKEWIEEKKSKWWVLLLSDIEWEQVKYLIALLKLF